MFIFKRDSNYHLEYFDEDENKIKRISTKCKKKSEALIFLSEFQKNIKSSKRPDFITIDNFGKKYLAFTKNAMSEGYNKNILYSFGLLKEHFGSECSLKKISSNDLESFLITKYPSAKYAASLAYRTLKSAFQKAVQWNYLDSNPLDKIKLPKIPQNKPVFISDIELRQIISYEQNHTLKDIYLFAFYSGCRINEILNLKWSCIDFSERIISIRNNETFTTKNKKERIIPISNYLFENLKNRLPKLNCINNDNYVFVDSKSKKFRADTVSKWFKKTVREASKKLALDSSIHFHTLRHSFASCLVQRNVSIYEISKLLGHSDIKVTEIYAHLKPENLRNAVELLN
jgi:integrase